MLSLKYIKENIELVKSSIKSKNIEYDIDNLLEKDKKRRSIIQDVEGLKSERNILNKNISKKVDVESSIEAMRNISKKIKALYHDLNTLMETINYD